MANFCTKCGKKLEKDEKCSCEKIKKETVVKEAVKEENVKNEEKIKSNSSNNIDILSVISNFLTKPIDTFNIEISKATNYLLILFTSIAVAFFSSIVFRYFYPFELFETFLIIICFAGVISVVANMMLKKVNTFSEVLDIVSKSSIVVLIGSLISLFFAFISVKIGLLLMICSIILFLFYVYHGISIKFSSDKNKIGYLLIISLIITILIKWFFMIIL